jgi:beta-glucanase (GH16 family)
MQRALSIVVAVSFLGLTGCQSGRVPSHPDIPSPGYSLVWHDEFDGAELDPAKWSHYRPGPRRDALNTAEAVTLDGRGHLVITTSRSRIADAGGQPIEQIRTGMISTEHIFQTTYGYFEARMQFQTQVGHWSAFWLQTPTMSNPIGDPATAGVEIDIMEYLRNGDYADKAQHTIHWDVRTPQQQRDFASVPIPGHRRGLSHVRLRVDPRCPRLLRRWTGDLANE